MQSTPEEVALDMSRAVVLSETIRETFDKVSRGECNIGVAVTEVQKTLIPYIETDREEQ